MSYGAAEGTFDLTRMLCRDINCEHCRTFLARRHAEHRSCIPYQCRDVPYRESLRSHLNADSNHEVLKNGSHSSRFRAKKTILESVVLKLDLCLLIRWCISIARHGY